MTDAARQAVLDRLRRLRRAMVARRLAETGALALAAAALASAAVQAGWMLASRSVGAALALCLLPLAIGLALAATPRLRRLIGLDDAATAWLAGICVADSAAALAALLAGRAPAMPPWAWPAIFLPSAALAAAAVTLAGRPALTAVAAEIDRQGGFRDRLATAAELSAGPADAAATPAAQCLFRQAQTALDSPPAAQLSFWTRTRRTPAALALSLLLCGTLLAADLLAPRDRLPADLADLPAASRSELARQLLQQMQTATPEELEALKKMVALIELKDPTAIRQELERLGKEGQALQDMLRERLAQLAAAARAAANPGGAGNNGPALTQPTQPSLADTRPARPDRPDGPLAVRVYDPAYPRRAGDNPPPTGAATPAEGGHLVPFDRAWLDARRRADQALIDQQVPPDRRDLVRRFFSQ